MDRHVYFCQPSKTAHPLKSYTNEEFGEYVNHLMSKLVPIWDRAVGIYIENQPAIKGIRRMTLMQGLVHGFLLAHSYPVHLIQPLNVKKYLGLRGEGWQKNKANMVTLMRELSTNLTSRDHNIADAIAIVVAADGEFHSKKLWSTLKNSYNNFNITEIKA
jgi:hypothetical protein